MTTVRELGGGTAVVLLDPYNDFASPLGKGWPLIREVANDVGLIANLRRVLAEARRRDIPVVYAPHKRHRRGDWRDVRFPTPNQFLGRFLPFFAEGRYGGRFRKDLAPAPKDLVATEHAVSSGFGGTDLDELLRSVGAERLVVCGLLTNTCVEATVRQAVDLGYHVTVLADGVAAWGHEDHAAGLEQSLPQVAHSIVTTDEFVAALA